MANSSLYNRFIGYSNALQKGGSKKSPVNNLLTLIADKKQLFVLTFLNLIFQLGITYYLMMKNTVGLDSKQNKSAMMTFMFILELIIIIILAFVPMPPFLKFVLFSIFSATIGVTLSVIKTDTNAKIIQTAIVSTLAIFGAMLTFGVVLIMFGIQLSMRFGLGLLLALLFLIIFQIVSLFLGSYSFFAKGLIMFSLALFSLYVVYDTNTILQRNYYGDFITASLDYYLDIINIFIDIVSLGGGRN
jgi:FtsH-binding integral membrane protein